MAHLLHPNIVHVPASLVLAFLCFSRFCLMLVSCLESISASVQVLLMGACVESHYGENNWAIITEYMPRGDLYGILHDPSLQLSMSQKLQFAIDVCQARRARARPRADSLACAGYGMAAGTHATHSAPRPQADKCARGRELDVQDLRLWAESD